MKIFNGLKFMFYSRGIKKGIKRFFYINKRFGLTTHKQIKRIRHYVAMLEKHDVKGTFFIPTTLIETYFVHIKKIETNSIEWGVHCDMHTDLSRLKLEEQKEHINHAIELFDKFKIAFKGFRAPYLRANNFTMDAINEKNRFLYNSSFSILWNEVYGEGNNSYNWARNFYNPLFHSQKISLPETSNGVVRMPVSLPDDDMLIDRDGLDADVALSIWSKILKICHEKKEIFVLQLHPERIYELDRALDALIAQAKKLNPPIWIASLGEVAEWWKNTKSEKRWPEPYQAAFCITGDIDSITILDFLTRLKKW